MSQTKKISYIYNPDRQSPEELISNFVIRLKEFKEIFGDIKKTPSDSPAQHYIVQGPRGTGKTTLLLRLYYEIQNDTKLKNIIVPVIFSEEQYHINNLCRLWESAAEYLEENDEFSGLFEEFEKVAEEKDYEDRCFELLAVALKNHKKKLVLLVDNIGDVLTRFNEKEHHRLREILLTSTDIRIIGASSVALEYNFDYSEPFFEFFKLVNIGGLDREETNALLISLGKNYDETGIQKIVDEQPERIEILRRLTGGIPRTIILLFEIFADDKSGDSFKDLEIILDRVTPLYKHRMEDLSRQQQQIVDAMAMSWDAVSTKEIAGKVRLDSKLVSAQLKQLEKNRIIHKIETGTKNYLYQITERFFNIWYLMRHGRRKDRNRVLWLVKFLKEWCGREELIERATRHISSLGKEGFYPGYAYMMTEALASTEIPHGLQHELIGKTRDFLSKKDKILARELSRSDKELYDDAGKAYKSEDYRKCLDLLLRMNAKNGLFNYAFGLVYSKLKNFQKAEEHYLMAIEKGHARTMTNLAILYGKQEQFEKAEKYFLMAVEKGHASAMFNLAILYGKQEQFEKAEKYYLMAVEKGHAGAMANLAILYGKQEQFEKAEKYYLMAIEKGHAGAMNNLAALYAERKQFEKAENYFLMAVEKGYDGAMANLAILYSEQEQFEKAEKYYLMAIEKGHAGAMANLAELYAERKQFEKAEKYYLMAVEKGHAGAMTNLAILYLEQEQFGKAEKYYLMAIENDEIEAMENLAYLYLIQKRNKENALLYMKNYEEKVKNVRSESLLVLMLLWNDNLEEALKHFQKAMSFAKEKEDFDIEIQQMLLFMIAKRQYHAVLQVFTDKTLNFKERFKPLYYALMYYMRDEFPNEYRKMGQELKETVDEIIRKIEKMGLDYA